MTLDIKTIPPVIIKEGTYGDVKIIKKGYHYFLNHNEIGWHQYNTKNMREYCEQWSSYDLAYGDVLISGFGFGQLATWLSAKPEVTSVTCIEISQDVVNAFLVNNSMPDKVQVIIGNAYEHKTDKHYDCIILDHISDGPKEESLYNELAKVAINVPNHNMFWFWSLELLYLKHMYKITGHQLYNAPVDFKLYDFSIYWQEYRNKINISTLPNLSKSKLDEYIDAFFLRHLIQ
jgi:hypothetical protein